MNRTPGVQRFLRYTCVGGGTLLFDLVLLVALTELAGVPYYVSTPFAFLVAVSVNYVISRKYVFCGTERAWHVGYLYFILLAIAAALIVTSAVALLVTYAGLFYLTARVLVAGVVGLVNYIANLYFNFRVAGKPLQFPRLEDEA